MNKMDTLIQLTKDQIKSQNAASLSILDSNIVGSKIIAKEIEDQTHALESTINSWNDKLDDSITFAADRISTAIDRLGNRISYDLSEIKWQLAQQNVTLKKIFEVHYESKSNEARQFVQQGVRLYVNDEFDEAEERFKLALNEDITNYQALMNLAYIEIHKSDFSKAFSYFEKAISLPGELDSDSKARTQWAIARLFYVQKKYEKAYSYAKQAFKNDNQKNPKIIYELGVYAALSGDSSSALSNIKTAIELDPLYFSKSVIEPDLYKIKDSVLKLLSEFSLQAELNASQLVKAVETQMEDIEIRDDDVHRQLNTARETLTNPSYSECLKIYKNMNVLQEIVLHIKEIDLHIKELHSLQSKQNTVESNYNSKEKQLQSISRNKPTSTSAPSFKATLFWGTYLTGVIVIFIISILQQIVVNGTLLSLIGNGIIGAIGGALWPLLLLSVALGSLVPLLLSDPVPPGALQLTLAPGIIGIIASLIFYRISKMRHDNREAHRNKIENLARELTGIEHELIRIGTVKYEIKQAIDKNLTDSNILKAQIHWS